MRDAESMLRMENKGACFPPGKPLIQDFQGLEERKKHKDNEKCRGSVSNAEEKAKKHRR